MRSMFIMLFITQVVCGFSQKQLSGKIVDATSGEPLSFAAIGFRNYPLGTSSNTQGQFELIIPDSLRKSMIMISYLGYKVREIGVLDWPEGGIILLENEPRQLQEIVVRALTPEQYIKRGVKRLKSNYPSNPYSTQAYYREKLLENGQFIHLTEAVFSSHYPNYQEGTEFQHQLQLFRKSEDTQEIQFMHDKIEKKYEKEQRKAIKRGEQTEVKTISESISENFGGPNNILQIDIMKNLTDCLDSTKFKKFVYSFGPEFDFNGRRLLVIEYKSRKKVSHVWQQGTIYMDLETSAFVSMDLDGKVVVPAAAKAALWVLGFNISNPHVQVDWRYQQVGRNWYPEHFKAFIDLEIKKRHLFSKNEESDFTIEQLFKVNHISTPNSSPIPEDRRFDPKKPMEEQIFNTGNISWNQVNKLPMERISQRNP